MNLNDFRYMYRGKTIQAVADKDKNFLESIEIKGDGRQRALLLLHGFSSSPAVYRQMIPHLDMYDAVVCPTLAGHGDSIVSFAKTPASQWVATAENACAKLINKYQEVDVMGLSLGGVLACHLSKKFNLHHLYLLAPSLHIKTNISLTLKFARVMHAIGFRHIRNQAGDIYTPGKSELTYRLLPIATAIEILTLIRDFEFIPPACATDVFLGVHDAVVDSDMVADTFLNLPNTSTHWLKNSAHILPIDGDVDEILSVIKKNTA